VAEMTDPNFAKMSKEERLKELHVRQSRIWSVASNAALTIDEIMADLKALRDDLVLLHECLRDIPELVDQRVSDIEKATRSNTMVS
jgi:hypothetical protein